MTHNTKSILKSAALIGAVTTTGAMATTTAHADTNSAANSNQVATTPAQQARDQYQAVQNQVQPQLDQAQSQLKAKQASQAASDAPKINAKNEQLQATAKAETEKENNSYNAKKAAQETANQKAVQKQEQANAQALKDASAHIVTPAQQAEQSANAQRAFDNQSTQIEAGKATEVKQAQANHQDNVKNLQTQISQKQSSASRDHDTQLKTATDAVNAAQTKVNTDTQANDQAQAKVNTTKSALDQAQANLKNAGKGQGLENTRYEALGGLGNDPLTPEEYKNYDIPTSVKLKPDLSHSTITQKADQIDNYADNISVQTHKDSSIFTGAALDANSQALANTINENRYQISNPHKVYASSYYNKLGEQIMEAYNASPEANKGEMYHAPEVLQDFTNRTGITIGECITGGGRSNEDNKNNINGVTPLLLTDLNYTTYEHLCELVGDDTDPNYGHARMILGTGDYTPSDDVTQYVTVNTDKNGCLHFLFFNVPNSQVDHSKDLPLTDPNKGKDNIAALQKAVNDAQSAYDTAKANAVTTSQQLAKDQAALTAAQNNLAQIKAGKVVDSPEVAQLKSQLDKENSDYQAKLHEIDQRYEGQISKLKDKLNKQLADIKAQPTSVDALKAQLNQKLATVKQEGQERLDKLAQEHQANLNAIKAKADNALAAYKQQLAAGHAKENQDLVDQINQLQQQLATAKAQMDQKLASLAPKQVAGNVVSGHSNSYINGNGQVINLAVNKTVNTHQVGQALPQTGNSNSIAVVALGLLGAMFGLGVAAKKRY